MKRASVDMARKIEVLRGECPGLLLKICDVANFSAAGWPKHSCQAADRLLPRLPCLARPGEPLNAGHSGIAASTLSEWRKPNTACQPFPCSIRRAHVLPSRTIHTLRITA